MDVAVSKWGNSLGIRIPVVVIESMGIKKGDSLSYEVHGDEMVLRKNISTTRLFEEFYGKPFAEISSDDIGQAKEIDWGDDIGGEVF